MNIYKVIKTPHITEKGNLAKELHNQVLFKVDMRSNKIEIKRAVETLFKIKVLHSLFMITKVFQLFHSSVLRKLQKT